MKLLVLILVWAVTLVVQDAQRVPFETALAEVVELTEAERHEEALAAARLLVARVEDPAVLDEALDDAVAEDPARADAVRAALESVRIVGLGEHERAAAHYALGVVKSRSEDHAVAASAALEFESARALAGPGELRLDATYDLGGTHLNEAERLRATLPEIAGAAAPASTPGLPPMQPGPPGTTGGAGDEEQPDPLPLARAAYETARGFLVERLRADWRDADTRANLELIQRRLRELDEIERQREEQQQEQQEQEQGEDDQQQDQQQDGEPNEDQEGEPSDSQDDSSAQEDPSADEQGEPEEQPDQPPEPSEESPTGEQDEPQPGQPPEPEGAEEQQPAAPQSAGEGEPEERVLTREEVMRLLDRLAELEEQGRELEAALQKARRTPVARDW